MALNGVQVVGPAATGGSKGRESGAKKGQVIGSVIGGTVGAFAGGPTGAMAGASAGGTLGGMAGDRIQPAQQGSSAMQRRIDQSAPQLVHSEQSDQLKQSLMALREQAPEIQKQYSAPLVKAYVQSIAQDNPRKGPVA